MSKIQSKDILSNEFEDEIKQDESDNMIKISSKNIVVSQGEENIENNEELNCTPSFNIKLYSGNLMQQITPKKMIKPMALAGYGCKCNKDNSNEDSMDDNSPERIQYCITANQWIY